MRLFDDIMAIHSVQKLKSGEKAKLSISQITTLLINLYDAKNNLNSEEFDDVKSLFYQYRKDTKKREMDLCTYFATCCYIIRSFDEIAPYELFSGGSQNDFSALMNDIRNKNIDIPFSTYNPTSTYHNNFCRICGCEVPENSKFCLKCGNKIINSEVSK